MIAHVAIRRTRVVGDWLYAHGWVLGAQVGAGMATSRSDAIRKACVKAMSAGSLGIALPAVRDYTAALELQGTASQSWPSNRLHVHEDPVAVTVALRAASLELMRECIRRYGVPDLGRLRSPPPRDAKWNLAQLVVDRLGGPETVATVMRCDAAQVVRWSRKGWPEVRISALRRELKELGA